VMIRSSILAALGTKAAIGGIAMAVATGTVAAAAASTGSPNPVNWGQHVVQVVQGCKKEVRTGGAASAPRTVGACVSAAASQHGARERARHAETQGGYAGRQPVGDAGAA